MPEVDNDFAAHPSLTSLKRLPSQGIFYGTAGEWVWLRAGFAERPGSAGLRASRECHD